MPTSRNCLECVHCEDEVDGPYSDLTPGTGLWFECRKGVWSQCMESSDTKRALSQNIDKAQTCPEFQPEEWARE